LRAVTTATAAAIIGLERNAFQNMITRIRASELPRGRQGLERRIPVTLLPRLLMCAELAQRLGLPFWEAYSLAQRLARGEGTAGPFIRIYVDLERIEREIDAQLETAVETVVRPKRGRPRGRGQERVGALPAPRPGSETP